MTYCVIPRMQQSTSGPKQLRRPLVSEERFGAIRQQDKEFKVLKQRLSLLSEASLRIDESLEFNAVQRAVMDGARPQRIDLKCAANQGVV